MADTTICIPVFNGEYWLDQLFQSIYSQKVDFEFDFLCVDSGSSDGSIEIIKKWQELKGVDLIEIKNTEYGHGKTRNYISSIVDTKYVFLITQDILPTSNDWLQKMHDALSLDKNISAVFCRHKAWNSSHPVRMRYIKKTFDDYLSTIKEFSSYTIRDGLSYFTNKNDVIVWDRVTAFSNVCAIYKKEIMTKIPFEDVTFAEDRRFMKTAIEKGYYIGYLDNVAIYHSHDYGYLGTLMRTVDEWKAIAEHGHFPYRFRIWHVLTQSIFGYVRDVQFCIFEGDGIPFGKRVSGIFTCLLMELMIKTGMYIGLNHQSLPSKFVENLSYQKRWREDKIK